MIVDVADGGVESHVSEEHGDVLGRRRRVFVQHLSKFRVARGKDAGALFAQCAHADHVNAASLRSNIEAADEQNSSSTNSLKTCFRRSESRTSSEFEACRFQPDNVV